MGMVLPLSQLFAHEVRGAKQYILGAMATGDKGLNPVFLAINGGLD